MACKGHSSLWLVGPERWRKLILWSAENPTFTRLAGAAELGLGVWLALRQYERTGHQEPLPSRPWHRRWFS